MQGVLFVDFDNFVYDKNPNDGQRFDLGPAVASFRQTLSPFIPVFWTTSMLLTGTPRPSEKDGWRRTDFLFIRAEPDDATCPAIDAGGSELIRVMKSKGIKDVYIGGASYYGSMLVMIRKLKHAGIDPYIMKDLTDYPTLTYEDHNADGAAEEFAAEEPIVMTSSEALDFLRAGPKPPDPSYGPH